MESKNEQLEFILESENGTSVDEIAKILSEAKATWDSRNAVYQDSYKQIEEVLGAFFPNGVTLKSAKDMSRYSTFCMCVGKLLRYSQVIEKTGHKDSAHDLINYAAILESKTK